MKNFTVSDIVALLSNDAKVIGNSANIVINHATSITEADETAIVWIKSTHKEKNLLIQSTKAKCIICDGTLILPEEVISQKCFIVVSDPRLAFLRVISNLFSQKIEYGIHPSSIIHPEAVIDRDVYIGPHCTIGNVRIESGTILFGHNYLYDNVRIGKNVIVHAGVIIGSDGYGFQRNEDGEFEKFPHIGGVLIGDNVEIGANTCIDRGTLGDTQIKDGAKIDNLVHVAHNVIVGKHSAVIAHAMIGGSTIIGDYSWVAPSVALMNGITIGNKVTVGMGAVATKNIPDNETWTGLPARPLKEFVELQKKLKSLLGL